MKIRNYIFGLCITLIVLLLPFNAAAEESSAEAADSPPEAVADGEAALKDAAAVGIILDQTIPEASAGTAVPDAASHKGILGNAETLGENIKNAIEVDNGFKLNILMRLGIAAAIIIAQALFIRLIWYFFKWFQGKLTIYGSKHFKSLTVKKFHIMDTKQILNILFTLLKIAKYIVTAFQLYLTIPIVFSLFTLTKNLADKLFGYVLNPLKDIGLGILGYIPNVFTIAIIVIITRYVIQTLKFFALRIEKERLVIPGFYADWARPTFNILRILLYAFMVAIIYPYLPGAESNAFQGVSVFVGIIVSLGSSSAIGNMVAGMVITYMRPFKIGDRIQLNDTVGFVVEKSAMVTRIITHKNEYVTFPNLMVLSSKIVNYHTSSTENEEGLILHAEVTMGYAVPWPQVHEILLAAAKKTALTEEKPGPYVLQTALDDYYARYQINVYTKAVEKVPAIYSELYQNLQDGFTEAGISLTAPAYQIRLPPESSADPQTPSRKRVFDSPPEAGK
ncbi:mechanosensitive ion channel family protein [Treponema primitia]|uniref:mechanosensitive ion channel family protein n=1 Tax=Treponema primitia TaxID=88058 RepID=UPI00025553E7|nr:mechanosensitive ion channel domain-containing protein [Treponema primitia]